MRHSVIQATFHALYRIMYELAVCSDGMTEAQPRSFRQNRPASEWTHKCSKRNSVMNIQDFPARNASGRASIALRRSAKAVPSCRRWSPPASCTCTCSAAVDAILHSFKNTQVVILDNDRSLSRITTCKCALWISSEVAV